MKTVRIRWTYLVIGALLVLSTFDRAKADTVLAQNGPHATFNAIPFSSLSGTGRYQEVYSSSLFGGPVLITSLAFSPSDSTLYSANVDLRMTTTMVGVGSLSPNLDSNFTVPLTTVYSNPTFSENVTGGSETFSLVFTFTNSFVYDPAQGNLLFDLLISGQNVALSFSRCGTGPILSRAYDTAGFGNSADGVGLRTLIGFEPVPEPGSFVLLGSGLIVLATTLRRKLIGRARSI
jgi:PEP-CTERM motif-containing protein